MKILMVVPALGEVYGGPSKSVLELTEAIGKQGVSIDIITTNANGYKSLDVQLLSWNITQNYRIQYFPYWNFVDYKFSWSLTSWLFKNVGDYDLVHTNAIFSYPVLPAYWSCQFAKVPYIVTPRGMLEPWALAYKSWKKKLYFNLLEKPALTKASYMQMLASTEAEGIESLALKTPLVIVPNGIHREDFTSFPSSEIFYREFPETRNKTLIIFLGRIDPKKGLDLLAPAFAQAQAKFPETHLIVAGPDNTGFLSTAESYFMEAGCKNAVTFTGMLTGTLKYASLAAANIYVAPSYSEGFSMSVLEGMAAGLPCVITTGCNFPEAGMANAASIVDINVDQIANALLQLLQEPILAKEMGDRARQFILENYTWDSIATKMLSIYQDITSQK
ncbi:glycosyltransferase [Nodularia spumigena]|uniref:Glycosyltransferase n=1 Tax=Nodularia spumigena UHCC 0060 TaxID=3110300 RepID=A0ABU5UXP7_NODSP|nr:glycosyltransferase [Nodularia spumigena]MEA5526350.1 glycosyltransferase [Nodularia spumigena UHCC 0143]MEA5611090.1 glycosyltransferase [Nodularia spumigena UHCC 0060]MEA5612871.1 glycosyltransferase [Nodularia spumigena UHCC 0040]